MRKWLVFVLLVALAVFAAACGAQSAPAPQAAAPTVAAAVQQAAPTVAAAAAPKATDAPKAAAAPTAAPAAGAVVSKPPDKNIVRINTGAYPDNLDPQQASFVNEIGFLTMLYEGLVSLGPDLTPQPGQAESWKVSDDGMTYTFKLRPGLKYSDGKPLTAKDFEFAFKRAADPVLAGQYQSSTFDIVGAEDYGTMDPKSDPAKLKEARDKMGVKALDDTTLEIKLNKRAAYFPYIAYQWFGWPVREDVIQKCGEDWWTKAECHIGNGVFKLAELKEKEIARFVPNPNWRGDKPKVDEVDYRFITDTKVAFEAYKNGELDIIGLAAEDLQTAQKDATLSKEILMAPGSCTRGIAFNLTKPPFDKRDVRLAFAKAVDRDAWTKDVLQGLGKPALSWMVEGIPGAKADSGAAQKFDVAAAKELLAKAGFPNGQGLPEIKMSFGSTPRNKIRAEFLAGQFQKNLGVNVVLDAVEPTTYTAMQKDAKTYPQLGFNIGWCSDYPDPQNWLTTYWRSTAFAKRYGYNNPDLDKLMDAADVEQDSAKRLQMYQQAENTILEKDVPYVPLDQSVAPYLVKPYIQTGKVTSHDPNWPGQFQPWLLAIKR